MNYMEFWEAASRFSADNYLASVDRLRKRHGGILRQLHRCNNLATQGQDFYFLRDTMQVWKDARASKVL